MVYFKSIRKTFHYIIHHEKYFPWSKVIEIIMTTKNIRKKGSKFGNRNTGALPSLQTRERYSLDYQCKSQEIMKCPNCHVRLKKVKVAVEDATTKAVSYQCPTCDYFTFDPKSAVEVVREIKENESPLKLKQKIIKLSKDRLGIYFNKDLIRSLNLSSGKEVFISVPDKKRIVLKIEE